MLFCYWAWGERPRAFMQRLKEKDERITSSISEEKHKQARLQREYASVRKDMDLHTQWLSEQRAFQDALKKTEIDTLRRELEAARETTAAACADLQEIMELGSSENRPFGPLELRNTHVPLDRPDGPQ